MGGKQTSEIIVASEIDAADSQNYKYHPYKVRGFARASKSGRAINFVIKESDGELHFLTVSKLDIIDSFEHGTQSCVIEYQLSDEEKKELKKNG